MPPIPEPPQFEAPGVLVKDAAALLATMRRLHALNDAVMFYNREGSLKLMLRNCPDENPDVLACDLCIAVDEDDENMERMLQCICDGYLDDPSTFVLDSWIVDADKCDGEVEKTAAAINAAYLMRVCPCRHYVIKDDGVYCTFCQLTSTAAGRQHAMCPICRDDGVRMHMTDTPCCRQAMHRACLAMCKARDARCPMCRQ